MNAWAVGAVVLLAGGDCSWPHPWTDPTTTMLSPDVNRDCAVDVLDVLDLLGAWGPYEGECSLLDLDRSGEVDVPDLLRVLEFYGQRDEDEPRLPAPTWGFRREREESPEDPL